MENVRGGLGRPQALQVGGMTSILQLLFETGNYRHILIAIFEQLDLDDLVNCSLVCSSWHSFITREILLPRCPGSIYLMLDNYLLNYLQHRHTLY